MQDIPLCECQWMRRNFGTEWTPLTLHDTDHMITNAVSLIGSRGLLVVHLLTYSAC